MFTYACKKKNAPAPSIGPDPRTSAIGRPADPSGRVILSLPHCTHIRTTHTPSCVDNNNNNNYYQIRPSDFRSLTFTSTVVFCENKYRSSSNSAARSSRTQSGAFHLYVARNVYVAAGRFEEQYRETISTEQRLRNRYDDHTTTHTIDNGTSSQLDARDPSDVVVVVVSRDLLFVRDACMKRCYLLPAAGFDNASAARRNHTTS